MSNRALTPVPRILSPRSFIRVLSASVQRRPANRAKLTRRLLAWILVPKLRRVRKRLAGRMPMH